MGRPLLLLLAALAAAEATAAQPVPTPRPIHFATGSARGWVGGHVERGNPDLFSLEAEEGQFLTVRLTAPNGNATFRIHPPDTALGRGADGALTFGGEALYDGTTPGVDATRWTGKLPASGIYLIVIESTRGRARYSMDVRLE